MPTIIWWRRTRPADGATTLDFDWDLSGLTKAGSNPTTLEVQVTDELGVTASVQSSVNIEVVPPPTPTVAPTIAPTAAPAAAGSVQQYGVYIGIALLCLFALVVAAVIVFLVVRMRGGSTSGGGGGGGARGGGGGRPRVRILRRPP